MRGISETERTLMLETTTPMTEEPFTADDEARVEGLVDMGRLVWTSRWHGGEEWLVPRLTPDGELMLRIDRTMRGA